MTLLTSTQSISFARKPHPREDVCGDDGAAWDDDGHTWLVISDGLGHGRGAADATEAALEWITANPSNDLRTVIQGCDRAIRHTRGVSLNMARVDHENRKVSYASVGANLGWKVQRDNTQRLSGDTGVVGTGVPSVRETTIELIGAGFLVLASDGVGVRSKVGELYTESLAGGSTLAESCLERWGEGKDDESILIYRFLP